MCMIMSVQGWLWITVPSVRNCMCMTSTMYVWSLWDWLWVCMTICDHLPCVVLALSFFYDRSIYAPLFGTMCVKPCVLYMCVPWLTQEGECVSLDLTLRHVCEDISLSLCVSCHCLLTAESPYLRTLPHVPVHQFLVSHVSKSVCDVSVSLWIFLHVSLSCVYTSAPL